MTSINSGRMKKGILAAFVAALALTAEIYAQTNDTGNMETKERIYGSVFPRGEKLPVSFTERISVSGIIIASIFYRNAMFTFLTKFRLTSGIPIRGVLRLPPLLCKFN